MIGDYEDEMRKICMKVRGYSVGNVYNLDETGLYYRILPSKSYLLRDENRTDTRGTRLMYSKERVQNC